MCANPRKLLLAATAGLLTYLAWPRYAATQTEPPRSALDDHTGTYRYHGGTTLALVAGDSALHAAIGEAKYPSRSGPGVALRKPTSDPGRFGTTSQDASSHPGTFTWPSMAAPHPVLKINGNPLRIRE